jgi:hypothetical protein
MRYKTNDYSVPVAYGLRRSVSQEEVGRSFEPKGRRRQRND